MKRKFLVIITAVFLIAAISLWLPHRKNGKKVQQTSTLNQTQLAPVPPQFDDKSLFLTPIKLSKIVPSKDHVTGITVPHHLLAADLIADTFKFASGGNYNQVLLFSPDHYFLGQTNVSISENDFSTVFGRLSTDTQLVKKLEQLPFVKNQSFFYREHGLGAELPFIKYYFPNAKIIALTFKESTPKLELEQVVEVLKKTLDKNALIIQSTDFSHYLTPANAEVHDEQTIKVLENSDPEGLFSLNQPDNIDSIASQYVQMRLQNELFASKLFIIGHKDSQDYTNKKIDSTTSYIIQAYIKK